MVMGWVGSGWWGGNGVGRVMEEGIEEELDCNSHVKVTFHVRSKVIMMPGFELPMILHVHEFYILTNPISNL